MSELDAAEVREAVLLRDPQPNDVVLIRIDPAVTEGIDRIQAALQAELGCRVVLIAGLEVVSVKQEATS